MVSSAREFAASFATAAFQRRPLMVVASPGLTVTSNWPTRSLHVDDVGRPGIGFRHLPDIEKNRLGLLAFLLLGVRRLEETRHERPQQIGIGRARVGLGEVKGAGPVQYSRCEGVAEGSGTGRGAGAFWELEFPESHVVVEVEGLDRGPDDGSGRQVQ